MLFQEIGGINNERAENQALLQQHFDMIFFTGGKTCVAPDYILCDKKIHDKLLSAILAEIDRQFGEEPLKNPDYGKIINEKHFKRILGLINPDKYRKERKNITQIPVKIRG